MNFEDHRCYFVQGQPVLQSMNEQLKKTSGFVDEKSSYKSDGLLKIHNLKDLELVLLESSGHSDKVSMYILSYIWL